MFTLIHFISSAQNTEKQHVKKNIKIPLKQLSSYLWFIPLKVCYLLHLSAPRQPVSNQLNKKPPQTSVQFPIQECVYM